VDPRPLWDALAGASLVLHNAAFDLAFLARMGFAPAKPVTDTMILSRLMSAGDRTAKHDLAAVADRYLKRTLGKTAQAGDWTGPLPCSKTAYAAADAAVLVPLAEGLETQIGATGLARVSELEARVVPAVARMAAKGVAFDREKWTIQAAEAQTKKLGIQ